MRDYPAEYDQEYRDNSIVEGAFPHCSGPADVYRNAYKYTACGPSVGFCISYWETVEPTDPYDYPASVERSKWFYCDDLRQLGTWADMQKNGQLIISIAVSSIVEGVDQTTDTYVIDCDPDSLEKTCDSDDLSKHLSRLFDDHLDSVDREAGEIWNATHGCEVCAKHWGIDVEGYDDIPVWDDCPECKGMGVIL